MCFAVSRSFAQPFAQQLFTFLEPVEFRNALCQWRKDPQCYLLGLALCSEEPLWIWGFAGVLQSTAVFVVQGALLNSLFWAKLTRYPPVQCLMASKIDLNLDFQNVKFQVTAKRNLKSLNRTNWTNWTNCCSDRSGIADAPGELWAYCQPDWGCGNGGLIATGRWRVEEFARRCFEVFENFRSFATFRWTLANVGHFEHLRLPLWRPCGKVRRPSWPSWRHGAELWCEVKSSRIPSFFSSVLRCMACRLLMPELEKAADALVTWRISRWTWVKDS